VSIVALGPTATAAAAWSWVEKMLQLHQRTSARGRERLDEHRGLDGMWSDPVIRAPFSGCASGVLGAQGHEAGHLVLGELDLLAAERGRERSATLKSGMAMVILRGGC